MYSRTRPFHSSTAYGCALNYISNLYTHFIISNDNNGVPEKGDCVRAIVRTKNIYCNEWIEWDLWFGHHRCFEERRRKHFFSDVIRCRTGCVRNALIMTGDWSVALAQHEMSDEYSESLRAYAHSVSFETVWLQISFHRFKSVKWSDLQSHMSHGIKTSLHALNVFWCVICPGGGNVSLRRTNRTQIERKLPE